MVLKTCVDWSKKCFSMKLAVAFLGLIFMGLLGLMQFPVLKINCQTQYGNCADELLNTLPDFTGHKWLDPIPDFKNYPGVQKISISKGIPGVVNIYVYLRKNLVVIYSLINQVQVVVDETGVLVEVKNNSNLPRLIVNEPLEIGKNITEFQLKACGYLYEASSIIRSPITARIIDQNLEISNANKQSVIISLTQTQPSWQSSLQSILARSKIDGKVPHKIDLRFENPVVVY